MNSKNTKRTVPGVFNTEEQNNLKEYLSDVYRRQIEMDLWYYVDGRPLPGEIALFFIDFFYNACMGWIISNIQNRTTNLIFGENINPLKNLVYEFMKMAIDNYLK